MSRKAEMITAVCTLGCALGIGYFMQKSADAELRYGTEHRPADATTLIVGEPPATPVHYSEIEATRFKPFQVQAIVLTSGQVEALSGIISADKAMKASADRSVQRPEDHVDGSPGMGTRTETGCPIQATADPVGGAMLSLTLKAPCLAGSSVIIAHDELAFTDVLSKSGELTVFVPALSETALVEITFASGETTTAVAEVDSLAFYDRVVVQWRGRNGVRMKLREFGVEEGNAGPASSAAGRNLPAAPKSDVGYLVSLGNRTLLNRQVADVYTFPAASTATAVAGNLMIETEVTADNCGRDITVRAIEISGGKKTSSEDLTLSVPECDKIGSFLVLKNLLQNLTLASK